MLEGSKVRKTHVIADFYKANSQILGQEKELKQALIKALSACNIVVTQDSFYQFQPEGVTALVISDELHFNIHTWPEYGSCAIDLYCHEGQSLAAKVCDQIKKSIEASEYELKVLSRASKKLEV